MLSETVGSAARLAACAGIGPARAGRRGAGDGWMVTLRVGACYGLAWRSFAKWWIPLCLVSGALTVFEFAPRVLLHSEVGELRATAYALLTAAGENDVNEMVRVSDKLTAQCHRLARQTARFTLYLLPLVGVLTVVLLMVANRAVGSPRGRRRSVGAVVYITVVHVVLVFVKLAAFLLCVVPGVYLYIKLVFVPLAMIELRLGAAGAVKASWRMTRGNYWRLLLLILMNAGVQTAAMVTVIGVIPATGFANTARAAAFRMLRGDAPAEPPA